MNVGFVKYVWQKRFEGRETAGCTLDGNAKWLYWALVPLENLSAAATSAMACSLTGHPARSPQCQHFPFVKILSCCSIAKSNCHTAGMWWKTEIQELPYGLMGFRHWSGQSLASCHLSFQNKCCPFLMPVQIVVPLSIWKTDLLVLIMVVAWIQFRV